MDEQEYIDEQIKEVAAEVAAGRHDTSDGVRPRSVWYSERDVAIGVTFPGTEGDSWTRLVRNV